MAQQRFVEATVEGAQSSPQITSIGDQELLKAKVEGAQPSNFKKLVRRLTKKVKPSNKSESSHPEVQDSPEDKLAGFMSRNPELFIPAKEEPNDTSLNIPEPVVRARTLSRSQRHLERLENPLIFDPTPEEGLEEQERAKETMRQSRTARFRKRLEEYF